MRPTVSVIIPAHNRERFIGDAVNSILAQTLTDFELVVVDDGSTDATTALVSAIGDPRVRLVRHERNRGIPAARNTGLEEAQGKYIAWLDSDDTARPHRLEEQVRFLESHPEVAMVGCCAGKIGPAGKRKRGSRIPPLAPSEVGAWLLFRSAFQQSSITGRADVLKDYPYHDDNPVCEDLDVFLRLQKSHVLLNLPRVLIDRRLHEDQTIRRYRDTILERKMKLLADPLERVGLRFTDDDLRRHIQLGNPRSGICLPDRDFLDWAAEWIRKLREANARSGSLDGGGLRVASGFFGLLACHAAVPQIGHGQAARHFAGSSYAADLLSRPGRDWLRRALPLIAGRQH